MGWLEGIGKVGARGEMGEALEGQDLLIKFGLEVICKKRKKKNGNKKGRGAMEEEDVEGKS